MKQTTHDNPISGTTPAETIELQYDTWAYELKVDAEAKQRPTTPEPWYIRLFGKLRVSA